VKHPQARDLHRAQSLASREERLQRGCAHDGLDRRSRFHVL